ncbi:hypothetical protein [Streptomyces roseifaciens]|uniref:hypothetical protein n=1 Tax=Streptomyces roseifaciens TaxID=1488406 RepID=UPI00118740D6|nr:hypothetical protein [Streptomyces roseifaciens]
MGALADRRRLPAQRCHTPDHAPQEPLDYAVRSLATPAPPAVTGEVQNLQASDHLSVRYAFSGRRSGP